MGENKLWSLQLLDLDHHHLNVYKYICSLHEDVVKLFGFPVFQEDPGYEARVPYN